MSNPVHTPLTEAKLIECEALRRAHHNLDQFVSGDLSPAYQKRVLDFLAKKYNRLLDKYGFDGLQIPMQDDEKRHGH